MLSRFLSTLLFRSASIQQRIEREQTAPRPDAMRLLKLKTLRLSIQDRLYRYGLAPAGEMRLVPVPVHRTHLSRNF